MMMMMTMTNNEYAHLAKRVAEVSDIDADTAVHRARVAHETRACLLALNEHVRVIDEEEAVAHCARDGDGDGDLCKNDDCQQESGCVVTIHNSRQECGTQIDDADDMMSS